MHRTFECEINSGIFLNLIELCKKAKSQISVCYSGTPGSVTVYGFHETIGLMKTIHDDSKKLDGFQLPIGIAIESSHLNAIEKEIKENNIEWVSIISIGTDEGGMDPTTGLYYRSFIFSKAIKCGDLVVPLLDFSKYAGIGARIVQEMSFARVDEYKELTNDPEFIAMCNTKADDGVSLLHIGRHILYIAPNMLNIVAGDEVSVTVYTAVRDGNLAVFTINRKKKKCIIKVILRIRDLRKQQ